jgi:NADP-reducing hydrogenase subunit HndB
MAIKSLDELKAIRDNMKKQVDLREKGESTEDLVEILVGMATCGIAAGARETLNSLLDEIDSLKLDNVKVVQVGCMGYCHSEPTIQVSIPGEEPTLYGKVDGEIAKQIVETHIVGGKLVDEHVLIKTFNKA